MVKVSSNRGYIKAVAVVTSAFRNFSCDGKKVHTVGLPNHWGFLGQTKPGYLVNTLTPFVGSEHPDARVQELHRQYREGLSGRRVVTCHLCNPRYCQALGHDHADATGAQCHP